VPLFSLFFYSTKNEPAFPGGRVLSSSRLRTGAFFLLHNSDDAKQPLAQGGLQFLLRTPLIKRIYGFSATGKSNVAAGKTGFAAILRHELHQQAFGAWLRVVRIVEIEAGGRIFENKIGTPRKALRFSVPAGIDEGEFARKTWRTSRLSGIGSDNCIACPHREERLLCPTATGTCFELTGDVIEPAQANFISRNEFLNFLKENGEAALRVAQQLGETYHAAVAEMRTIGLSHSAGEKLARLYCLLAICLRSGGEPSGRKGPSANQADADARRNRADDRVVARDGDEAASGFPEKATGAGDGLNAGDQEQVGVGGYCNRLKSLRERPSAAKAGLQSKHMRLD
jgi:hypothetical protein